jgi:hypothetical protein
VAASFVTGDENYSDALAASTVLAKISTRVSIPAHTPASAGVP